MKTAAGASTLIFASGSAAAQRSRQNENVREWLSGNGSDSDGSDSDDGSESSNGSDSDDEDPYYADPEEKDDYEYDLTYQHPDEPSEYRIYVDGEIVQSDWGYASYNETVEGEETDEYVVISAESGTNNVDGYFFNGELLAIYTEHDAQMWLSDEELDPNDYPDYPGQEIDADDDRPDDAVVVSPDGSSATAEAPNGSTYSAGDVGALINAAMRDGHREFHIQSGTYTLDTRITARDGMTLRGQDDPRFEITWGNTSLWDSGTKFDIAVYTNPDASTSDVTIDGIVFDAVEEPSNPSESQIIGDPRNVSRKYNWTIRNCEFHHAPKYAINMDHHQNPRVENCRFYNGSHWWFGIHLRMHTVRNGTVIDCYFGRNGDNSFPALRLDGFDTVVRGCEFDDINAVGIDVVDIHVNHGIEFQIRDCQFNGDGGGTGVLIDHVGASDSSVVTNQFADLDYGIREVTSAERTYIADNTFSNVRTNVS